VLAADKLSKGGNMMSRKYQQGNSHLILIIALCVALISVLTFVFYQNYSKNNKNIDSFAACQKENGRENLAIYSEQCISKDGQVFKNPNQQNPSKKQTVIDKGYLVLDDWKVKMKLPTNGTEVTYYKINSDAGGEYEFSTKAVESLGESCKEPTQTSSSVTRLATLLRFNAKDVSEASAPEPINNEELIGDYYYYVAGAQSTCASTNMDIQVKDRQTILDMLKTTQLK
jgi:hypothetical protein